MKKKSQSAHFSPPGRWTGNNFLFKGGLVHIDSACVYHPVFCTRVDSRTFLHTRVMSSMLWGTCRLIQFSIDKYKLLENTLNYLNNINILFGIYSFYTFLNLKIRDLRACGFEKKIFLYFSLLCYRFNISLQDINIDVNEIEVKEI